MSKKHFEAFASEILAIRQAASDARKQGEFELANRLDSRAAGAEDLVLAVAPKFNPNFDSCRFVEACRP